MKAGQYLLFLITEEANTSLKKCCVVISLTDVEVNVFSHDASNFATKVQQALNDIIDELVRGNMDNAAIYAAQNPEPVVEETTEETTEESYVEITGIVIIWMPRGQMLLWYAVDPA